MYAGDPVTRWGVVERQAHITDLPAKNDATHLRARESVPLAWAIPWDARPGRPAALYPCANPVRVKFCTETSRARRRRREAAPTAVQTDSVISGRNQKLLLRLEGLPADDVAAPGA